MILTFSLCPVQVTTVHDTLIFIVYSLCWESSTRFLYDARVFVCIPDHTGHRFKSWLYVCNLKGFEASLSMALCLRLITSDAGYFFSALSRYITTVRRLRPQGRCLIGVNSGTLKGPWPWPCGEERSLAAIDFLPESIIQ